MFGSYRSHSSTSRSVLEYRLERRVIRSVTTESVDVDGIMKDHQLYPGRSHSPYPLTRTVTSEVVFPFSRK